MLHPNNTTVRRYALLSFFLTFFLTFSAGNAFAQVIDCCEPTDDYDQSLTLPDPGYYLCVSKTVPGPYQCLNCSTALNCKWLHFRNLNAVYHSGRPASYDPTCCYTKFELTITKDANSSSFVLCYVSNNWDCKTGCDDAWTIRDITAPGPPTTITEGACNSWGGSTSRVIEITPTNGANCDPDDPDCSIDLLNHFLTTLCGVSDIDIRFYYTEYDADGDPIGSGSCTVRLTDANIPYDACPDTENPCY